MPRRSWRSASGRACGCWCASTSSTASSRSSSSCRATATIAVVREKIGAYLKTVFDGRLSAYYPAFPEGGLARVHFIIGRSGGKTPKVEQATLEAAIRDIVRTWEDALREAAASRHATRASRRSPRVSRKAIAAVSRRPRRWPTPAASPARRAATRSPSTITGTPARSRTQAALKIYHFGEPGGAVAARAGAGKHGLPRHQRAHLRGRRRRTATSVFIHDMELENAFGKPIDLADGGALFEEVFLSVWRGDDRQ